MADEDLAIEQEETGTDTDTELSEEEQEKAELKEALIVEKEEIGSLRMKLTVTVPQELLEKRRGKQFEDIRHEAQVPGFRKGRAPVRLIEKRFGSDVNEQLKGQLLGSAFLAATEKEDLKPLGDPRFWITAEEERVGDDGKPRRVQSDKLVGFEEAIDEIKLPKDGPLTFSCELELKPEFDLPKLDGIPVEKPKVAITEEDIDNEVRRLCMLRGTFKPVEDGPVEKDDALYVDLKMSVDGEVIDSESNADLPARDTMIKGIPAPGFGDAVAGKKLGDTFTFEAVVPDDHDNKDLRGKTATFQITITEIKRLEVPALDETLLKSIGFESEQELRDTLRQSMESRLEQTLRRGMRQQIADYLIDHTEFELPDELSQRQTDRAVTRRMIEMYQEGLPRPEIEKRMDELRARAKEQAVRDLKLFFIMEKIAEERDIDVSEERINTAIAQMAQQSGRRFDRVRDELSQGDGLMMLYLQLRDQQVLDDLLDEASVIETEEPKKKAGKSAGKGVKKKKKARSQKPGDSEQTE